MMAALLWYRLARAESLKTMLNEVITELEQAIEKAQVSLKRDLAKLADRARARGHARRRIASTTTGR